MNATSKDTRQPPAKIKTPRATHHSIQPSKCKWQPMLWTEAHPVHHGEQINPSDSNTTNKVLGQQWAERQKHNNTLKKLHAAYDWTPNWASQEKHMLCTFIFLIAHIIIFWPLPESWRTMLKTPGGTALSPGGAAVPESAHQVCFWNVILALSNCL